MARVGQRKYHMVAVEAKPRSCETLEKFTCNEEVRSSLCLQNNFYMSPKGNAECSQKLPSCAHSCQAVKSHQSTRQPVQLDTEMPTSLQETQRGHSQPQFLYA